MNEKDKHNKAIAADRQHASAQSATVGQPPSKGKDRFVSSGERIHNELTYRGVDYVVNAAAGVAFAFFASRTHTGNEWFTKPVTGFFQKHVVRPFVKSEQAALEPAKWGTKFAAIMFGGTVTIPLIMGLEHKPTKVRIIKSLDEDIYGEYRVANDPKFESAYEEIAKEPAKSFTVGMVTRIIAIVPLIAGSMMFPRTLSKYLYDPIAHGSRVTFRKLGIKPNEFMMKKAADETGAVVTNWEHLHKTIGFDFGLTIGYSLLHERVYKGMTSMLNPKHEEYSVPVGGEVPELTQEIREEDKASTKAPLHSAKPDTKIYQNNAQHADRIVSEHAAAQHV